MNSFTPVLINLGVYTCTMMIILTVFTTGVFEAIYTREMSIKGNGQNESARNEDDWPFKMSLRMSNFHCNVPSPNLDLTDEQLTDAWQLPRQTRLSPTMRDIARCQLAAKWIRTNKGEWHEERRCFCVELWWLLAVIIVTTAAFAFYSSFFFCRSPPKTLDITSMEELRAGRCGAALWFLIWYLTLCLISMRSHDAGMSYTPYGGMNPQAYYNKEPVHWFVIFIICLIICSLEGIKILLFSNAICKFKQVLATKQRRAAIVNDQSPPSYNEAVSFEKMWDKAVSV